MKRLTLSAGPKKEAEEEAEQEARKIIATAINRLSAHCVSEATVNTVSIPNEEMKVASSAVKGAISAPWKGQRASISSSTKRQTPWSFPDSILSACRWPRWRLAI